MKWGFLFKKQIIELENMDLLGCSVVTIKRTAKLKSLREDIENQGSPIKAFNLFWSKSR